VARQNARHSYFAWRFNLSTVLPINKTANYIVYWSGRGDLNEE
jgi:hypothetical protein